MWSLRQYLNLDLYLNRRNNGQKRKDVLGYPDNVRIRVIALHACRVRGKSEKGRGMG